MSETWSGRPEPAFAPLTPRAILRGCLRGGGIALVVAATACVFLPVLAVERLARTGPRWTPRLASVGFAGIVRCLGLRRIVTGRPQGDAVVANHSSWLDVAILYADGPVVFVSKAEVARWPVIGVMTRMCGTVFIERRRSDAALHRGLLAQRLAAGPRVVFFPEGTSTDGQRVLPFKTTLFAAFAAAEGRALTIQPVGLRYDPPPGHPPEFHAWWGDMAFAPHAARVICAPKGGSVTVRYGTPVAAGSDRKALARTLQREVRTLAVLNPPSPPEAA